jgi:tRNA dimethylallyltransferase
MRATLEEYRIKHGNIALWERLHEIDPLYARELHPNNYHYVIRGIEVMTKTGISKLQSIDIPTLKYDVYMYTPYDGDREKLYQNINMRVSQMFLS